MRSGKEGRKTERKKATRLFVSPDGCSLMS